MADVRIQNLYRGTGNYSMSEHRGVARIFQRTHTVSHPGYYLHGPLQMFGPETGV